MAVEAIFYQEHDGTCPVLEFLQAEPIKVRQKAYHRIDLLRQQGHAARRPLVENLGQGLYELRWRCDRVRYRLLYFFHGQATVVLAHALPKEAEIPRADLERAQWRKTLFESDPRRHTKP